MRSWAGAALSAAILMTAKSAMAGGYWDAGGPPGDPAAGPPRCALRGPPCPPPPCPNQVRGAASPPADHAWGESRVWRREYRDTGGDVVIPAEFFDGSEGVGPDTFIDEGGGEVIVEGGGSAGAEAFASASASARVGVQIGFHGGRFHHRAASRCLRGGHGRR